MLEPEQIKKKVEAGEGEKTSVQMNFQDLCIDDDAMDQEDVIKSRGQNYELLSYILGPSGQMMGLRLHGGFDTPEQGKKRLEKLREEMPKTFVGSVAIVKKYLWLPTPFEDKYFQEIHQLDPTLEKMRNEVWRQRMEEQELQLDRIDESIGQDKLDDESKKKVLSARQEIKRLRKQMMIDDPDGRMKCFCGKRNIQVNVEEMARCGSHANPTVIVKVKWTIPKQKPIVLWGTGECLRLARIMAFNEFFGFMARQVDPTYDDRTDCVTPSLKKVESTHGQKISTPPPKPVSTIPREAGEPRESGEPREAGEPQTKVDTKS